MNPLNKVYDERIDLANATRRGGSSLKSGYRLVATLDMNRALSSANVYYTVVTALMSPNGGIVERYRKRRDGRIQGVSYGTSDLMPLDTVPATREADEPDADVGEAAKAAYAKRRDARAEALRVAAEQESNARRAQEFAEQGRILTLSGLKGCLYELPDGSYVVQLGGPTEPFTPVCCRYQGIHLIDNRIRGKVGVPSHCEDCPTGT